MKFIIYEDSKSEWRWNLVAKNGKIIADSGEGYNSKGNAHRALKTFTRSVHTATTIVEKTKKGEEQ